MADTAHTSKALASVHVNGPVVITEVTRAHDPHARTAARLEHLYEAQRLCLDMATEIQGAISIELQRCGAAAVPQIAARIRAVAAEPKTTLKVVP